METILATIISALVAGATAKASEIGGKALADSYEGLKSLIVRKLGMGGTVQSIEDEPHSELAQAALAEAIVKRGLASDPEIAAKAKELNASLTAVPTGSASTSSIDVGNIYAKVNATVEGLVATGRIRLGDITAETGDARVTNL